MATSGTAQNLLSPLEVFLQRFCVCAGGIVEVVEPQVYDMLLPEMLETVRVTLDPDALPEHPSAQLLAFGSPLLDSFLARARAMGRVVEAYVQDVNLTPYGIEQQASRKFIVPDGVTLRVDQMTPRHVSHSVFWFKATYVSDSKEEALYAIGLDLYYGRQVKHLTELAVSGRLVGQRLLPVPDAPSIPLEEVYAIALNRLERTIMADAHVRKAGLLARLSSQRERIRVYYENLMEELDERAEKLLAKGEDEGTLESKRVALRREEALRIEEIERKGIMRAELRLANVLHIKVPRLFLTVHIAADSNLRLQNVDEMILTWDPLTNSFDAAECPNCKAPTYEFIIIPRTRIGCPNCQPPTQD